MAIKMLNEVRRTMYKDSENFKNEAENLSTTQNSELQKSNKCTEKFNTGFQHQSVSSEKKKSVNSKTGQ